MSADISPLFIRDLNTAALKISFKNKMLLEEDGPPCCPRDQQKRLIPFSFYVLTSIRSFPPTLIKRLMDASLNRVFLNYKHQSLNLPKERSDFRGK